MCRELGCVAQLVEQRSPKSLVGGSNPSALVLTKAKMKMIDAKLRDLSVNADEQRPKKKWGAVIREYKDELKRVSWTSKEELKLFTKVVVGTTFAFGLGIYFVDLVIKGTLHLIGRLVH